MRVEVVAIGTELLLGQIVDSNSSWIGEQLAMVGLDSYFQTKVGDNMGRIVEVVELVVGGRGVQADHEPAADPAQRVVVAIEPRDLGDRGIHRGRGEGEVPCARECDAVGEVGGNERLDVHRQRVGPAAFLGRQRVVRNDDVRAMIQPMSPDGVRIAEPAHREHGAGRGQCQSPVAAEVGRQAGDAPRSGLPGDCKARGVEMRLGALVGHDDGTAIPRRARGLVVAVEEQRAVGEIARRP